MQVLDTRAERLKDIFLRAPTPAAQLPSIPVLLVAINLLTGISGLSTLLDPVLSGPHLTAARTARLAGFVGVLMLVGIAYATGLPRTAVPAWIVVFEVILGLVVNTMVTQQRQERNENVGAFGILFCLIALVVVIVQVLGGRTTLHPNLLSTVVTAGVGLYYARS